MKFNELRAINRRGGESNEQLTSQVVAKLEVITDAVNRSM